MVVNFFRLRRTELGVTQREIAERLGITPQSISNWERGEALPLASDYPRVAKAYEVDPQTIATEVMHLACEAAEVVKQ